jgi:p21-activated kinase 1
MVFSSREETHDSNIPSNTSSRTLTCQGSISNFSVHTASTATTHDEDLNIDPSGQGPDRDLPIPDHKSSHSLEKRTLGLRNQSLSTVCTIREPESDRSSVETSTPKQELCSLSPPSPEGEAVSSLPSTPRSSAYSPVPDPSPSLTLSTRLDDLLTNLHCDSQPPAIIEISKADKAAIRPVPFLPPPTDRLGTTSRSRSGTATVKGKKGVLGFMTDFRNSNKRPEITTPHDLVHLTHVDFNPSTGEFTGLPQEWQQLLQDAGISKSDQERSRLSVMEIVKLYQEGGGDVRDKMDLAPTQGSSRRSPIPGAAHAAYPEAAASVNAAIRESPNSSTDVGLRSEASKASNGPVVEPDHQLLTAPEQQSTAVTSSAETAGAIPRRREKKDDEENEADIVDRLQQICTNADPTRLYRNLVKIDQGYVCPFPFFRFVLPIYSRCLLPWGICSTSGTVFTAYQVGTNFPVAIKQMDLDKQSRRDLIINEILVMRASRHANIVSYVDSFLYKNELWVVMEYMEGGTLTDVVMTSLMSEGQVAAVSREITQGLQHLHEQGIIHRDIKSSHVLLSLTGDIKISMYHEVTLVIQSLTRFMSPMQLTLAPARPSQIPRVQSERL